MIPKKGRASSDVGEYRGISLLSNISKLIERIIKNRLYKHLEENKILNIFQSGFRDKRSATENLFYFTQKIGECFQKKKRVCEIFFDISKTFDKVWHTGLLCKLIKLGLPNYLILFVKNFLAGRSFNVKINSVQSKTCHIGCSVPQGSVLGPILFLI